LIFSGLQVLLDAEDWFCDGTFKTVPQLYTQLFTVHALIQHQVIPCIYALLPNKTQRTYEKLLHALNGIVAPLNPQTILIDFEKAAQNAFHVVFPNALIKGCFFHLCQNIYRKVQSSGLQVPYSTDLELQTQIKMVGALAFIPPGEI
jgi:hypothetical protein